MENGGTETVSNSNWPRLDGLDLPATVHTMHLWSQVVGKVRLALTPWENHSWNVTLYLSPRGYGTGLMQRPGEAVTAEFDLLASELVLRSAAGGEARIPLRAGSLADFHRDVLAAMDGLGVPVAIDPMPCEIPDAVRFDEDDEHRTFDPEVARAYWRAMLEAQRVLQLFRTRFTGKVSPIHLFWGAFDLAVTRFSGRAAPPHPGGAPHVDDAVMREAYCREVSSAGFWPNIEGTEGPCFYSYAYPVPDGYAEQAVLPDAARFDAQRGEFILPYADVVVAPDPDAALLDFLQSTYDAAADLAKWDRDLLERAQGLAGEPPAGS